MTPLEVVLIIISMRPKTIGQQVREWRERQGLSQRALAKAAGISNAMATKIENEDISDPRLSTLRALAAALGVTVAELIGEGRAARRRTWGKK